MVLLKVICLVSGTLADHSVPSFFEPSDVANINISEAPSINDQDSSRSSHFDNSGVESILSSLDLNNVNTSKPPLVASTSLPQTKEASNKTGAANCPCANESRTMRPGVLEMKEQIKNKTSLLSKIRHRATHSRDALWASIVMTAMIVMLVIAVLHTKMWQDTTFVSNQDSQPVKYEQYNSKAEIPVKDMLRGRARSLLALFKNNSQKKRQNGNSLSMETFMTASEDTVDSSHQFLLESSSEDDMWNHSDSDSEEDIVFKMNKRTGDWEGDGEGGESLLGSAVRYVRRKNSKDEVSNSILREISRVSSCSESSELEFMRIG